MLLAAVLLVHAVVLVGHAHVMSLGNVQRVSAVCLAWVSRRYTDGFVEVQVAVVEGGNCHAIERV